MSKFQVVSSRANENIKKPIRSTAASAGYDFFAAEEKVIPSYIKQIINHNNLTKEELHTLYSLSDHATLIKKLNLKPILVPTGIKAELENNQVLQIFSRSSVATKNLMMLANSTGIIDSDYYENIDNEGEIMVPFINLSPFDVIIHKDDKIAQGIISNFIIVDDDEASGERIGGFGSTGK